MSDEIPDYSKWFHNRFIDIADWGTSGEEKLRALIEKLKADAVMTNGEDSVYLVNAGEE